jgi:hypothetical protein
MHEKELKINIYTHDQYHTHQPLTETHKRPKASRRGILRAYIGAEQNGGITRQIQAILDTGASRAVVNQESKFLLQGKAKERALRKLHFLEDEALWEAAHSGKEVRVTTIHGTKAVCGLGVIRVHINGRSLCAIAIAAGKGTLPPGVEMLLDADTIAFAGISVDQLLQQRRHTTASYKELPNLYRISKYKGGKAKSEPQQQVLSTHTCGDPQAPSQRPLENKWYDGEWMGFIEETEQIQPDADDLLARPNNGPLPGLPIDFFTDGVFLSEIKCKQALMTNPNLFKPKSFKIEDLHTDAGFTTEQRAQLLLAARGHKGIFSKDDGVPKPMHGLEPVELATKKGAKSSYTPMPRWGKYQETLLRLWTLKGMADGMLEKADPNCRWASRPHLVPKPNHGIRVTGDYVNVNKTLDKLPVRLPNMDDQLRRHKGSRFFLAADAIQGYHQRLLATGSRQKLAIWTPLGLMVPTRLQMGTKNAGSSYQAGITTALSTLPKKVRERTSNYMDDFLVSGRTYKEFIHNVKAFFRMCQDQGITLNPAKTKAGFKAKMLGREVDGDTIHVHEDNLSALRNCQTPKDIPQLKHVLGIMAYAMKHVKNYATIAAPLFHLTKKGVPWDWPPDSVVDKAFIQLKAAVLEKFKLHVPDQNKPMYLFTDASDVGMGAHLCQLKHAVDDADLHKVPDKDKLTIAFYSARFDARMQQRPVYYREAKAIMWGLEKSKEFTEQNPFEVCVVTDHSPLQWIKSTHKGAVSAWLIENAAETDFRVVYIPGPTNTTADALSREPLVSPSRFNLLGASHTWDALLRMLPDSAKHCSRAHVWSAQHTIEMQRKVQAWRHKSNAINVKAPKSMLKVAQDFDLIISAPAAEEAPVVAHNILRSCAKTATVAVLVPTDLVNYIPSGGNPKMNLDTLNALDEKLRSSRKITFSNTNYTWCIFNTPKGSDKVITTETIGEIYLGHMVTDRLPTQTTENYGNVDVSEVATWIAEQQKSIQEIKKHYKEKHATTSIGLHIVLTETGNKIYVPKSKRKPLVKRVHEEMIHGMTSRIRKAISRQYIWPKMSSDIMQWVTECKDCPLQKAKKLTAHNQYSPTEWRKPRSAYGVDFYGIAKSKNGYVGVLTAIDLFSRWVTFIPVRNETAETFAHSMMEHIVWKRGAFKVLVSDGANAFVGKVASQLAKILKIEKVETFCYPQGNSTTERVHTLLGEFLRLLPENKRNSWDEEIGAVAYANNLATNTSTGFSPFELDCGFQPSTAGDLMFQQNPSAPMDAEIFLKTEAEQLEWVKRVQAMHEIARRCNHASKEITIQRLNKAKGNKRSFEQGEKILLYVPKQSKRLSKEEKDNGRQSWKSKHLTHWRRGEIVKKLSSATYEVKDTNGTTFVRSVSLINKDKSQQIDKARDELLVETTTRYKEGTTLAVKSKDRHSTTVEIARVVKALESGEYWVHYYGTTGKNPKTATFKPAFHDINNRVTLAFHRPKKEKPWEGSAWDEMIVGEVKFKSSTTSRLVLNSEAIKLLESAKVTINSMSTAPSKKAQRKKRPQPSVHPDRKALIREPKKRKVRFAELPRKEGTRKSIRLREAHEMHPDAFMTFL